MPASIARQTPSIKSDTWPRSGIQYAATSGILLWAVFSLIAGQTLAQAPKYLAWGSNQYKQVGAGPDSLVTLEVWTDLDPMGSAEAVKLAIGDRHAALLASNKLVYTWGFKEYIGRTSSAPGDSDGTMAVAENIASAVDLAATYESTIILKTDGQLMGWGYSRHGELGSQDDSFLQPTPAPPSIASSLETARFNKLWGGGCWHYAAENTVGNFVMWGDNRWGQIADDPAPFFEGPVATALSLGGSEHVTGVSLGCMSSFALTTAATNNLQAWGRNDVGQLGLGNIALQRGTVPLPSRVTGVASGTCHSVALLENGVVYGWGCSSKGQLGPSRDVPYEVSAVPLSLPPTVSGNVAQVSVLGNTTFFLLNNGQVWSVGTLDFKITAQPGQPSTGFSSIITETTLHTVVSGISPASVITQLFSFPYYLDSLAYAGFAEVKAIPAPVSSSPPTIDTPPSSPPSFIGVPPSFIPAIPATPTTSDTPCPLPAPIPPEMFQCINGSWVAPSGVGGNGTVIIGPPVVVIGDWNTTGTVIIVNPSGNPTVINGCLYLNGSLQIEINPDEVGDRTYAIFQANCIGPNIPLISVQTNKKSCKKVSAVSQVDQNADGTFSLSVAFKTDDFKCKVWWIVLASVLGGIVIFAAIFATIASLNPKCRAFFRPHAKREEEPVRVQ